MISYYKPGFLFKKNIHNFYYECNIFPNDIIDMIICSKLLKYWIFFEFVIKIDTHTHTHTHTHIYYDFINWYTYIFTLLLTEIVRHVN